MIRRIVEIGTALAGTAPLLLVSWLVRAPRVEPEMSAAASTEAAAPDTGGRHFTLEGLAARRTPFRASGQPPLARFGAAPVVAAPSEPAGPRPVPVLTGLLWSAEPAAIVEGLPGMEAAALVQQGQRIGPIQVRRIARDRVELSGLDTFWVLRVRQPWR